MGDLEQHVTGLVSVPHSAGESSLVAPAYDANDDPYHTPFMDPSLMKRPARKQVAAMTYFEDHASDGQDYNIWYHKRPGFRSHANGKFEDRELSSSRCNVMTDTGKTRANKHSPFCVYFCQGRCALGPDCTFLHRIPCKSDEKKTDLAHDIFGRERHRNDRDDMGGVGSFSRENRTLYLGGIKNFGGAVPIEAIIRRHFEEWGPIEYVRVIHSKSIAFVRYLLRSSAEFAKEAMNNQDMDNKEVLAVKWATEDANPIAKLYEERRLHREATSAVNKRIKLMDPVENNNLYYEISGQYPNTDTQFVADPNDPAAVAAQAAAYYQYNYQDAGMTEERHPYARGHVNSSWPANADVPAVDPSQNPYAYYGYGYGNADFVPTYKTAERELAEYDQQAELAAQQAATPASDVAAPAAHTPADEEALLKELEAVAGTEQPTHNEPAKPATPAEPAKPAPDAKRPAATKVVKPQISSKPSGPAQPAVPGSAGSARDVSSFKWK